VLATGFGLGYAPFAPGTFGSALGVVLALPLLRAPLPVYALAAAAIAGLAIWAAGVTQQATGRHDDGRIVADEVAGQIVALAPLCLAGALPRTAWAALIVTGFVTFRVFDVWKPGPVGWAERSLPGGAGVVADDLLAGALAALVLAGGMWLLGEIGWLAAPFGAAADRGVRIG
jgi:phosphatidylglycerophosphatase A